jgi:hypothetical protein
MTYRAIKCPGLDSLHPGYQSFIANACQMLDNKIERSKGVTVLPYFSITSACQGQM